MTWSRRCARPGTWYRPSEYLDSLTELRSALIEWQPEVVFNLLEEFNGIVTHHDQSTWWRFWSSCARLTPAAIHAACCSRATKCCASSCWHSTAFRPRSSRCSGVAKAIRGALPRRLHLPLFVKSATEDASLGIAQASVGDDVARLRDRVQFVHEQIGSDALVEEYIEGRELYVGVLGNERLTRLPVWEMRFGSMPESAAAIATRKVKWDRAYQKRYDITTRAAEELPPAVLQRLDRLSRRIYKALHLSGYARIDFRVRNDGSIFMLEANANPNLTGEEDFAESARAAGIDYRTLLERIMALGRGYRVEWRNFDA